MFYSLCGRILKTKNFWFATERQYQNEDDCDVAIYHDMVIAPEKIGGGGLCSIHMTFVTSLKDSDDYIWSCFGKNVKYEIHRAEKEGSGVKAYTSQDLSENIELFKAFDKVYAAMYRSKGIVVGSTLKSDIAIASQGNLLMTVGYLSDGSDVVYHVYVIDGKNARLLYSASDFRNSEDNQQRNKIGRLNRYLHWKDILYFKDEGYDEYDWGGYSLDADKKSITDFKAGFGGVSRKTYVYTYELTWKAKLVKFVKMILRK